MIKFFLKNLLLFFRIKYGQYKEQERWLQKDYHFDQDKHPIRKIHNANSGWSHQNDRIFRYRKYDTYSDYLVHQKQKFTEILKLRGGLSSQDLLSYRIKFFKRFRFLKKILPWEANILCLGARQGTEVEVLRDLGFKNSVGIDLNPGPCNEYVFYGDFMKTPFKSHSFDLLYTNCLDHSFDLSSFFQEQVRILKTGGFALLDLPVQDTLGPFESVEWKSESVLRRFISQFFPILIKTKTEKNWKWLLLKK